MAVCLLGLGSNVGDRPAALQAAVTRLAEGPGIRVLAVSRPIETAAVGGPAGQPAFLNAAALIETGLLPAALLRLAQQIELSLGRTPGVRWGPRPLDVDLLLYDEERHATPELRLPHPRMAWRRFVLAPAAEIAPAMVHPQIGWTVRQLLDHLDRGPPYVAITGPIAAGKSLLAERVAGQTGARLLAEPLALDALAAFYENPASQAWQTELEFVETRRRLLAADADYWCDHTQWTVSDFWFDQSAAFAGVWLPEAQRAAYDRRFATARAAVASPRLLVVADAPPEELARRVRARGRHCEQALVAAQLGRIRAAIRARAEQPGLGPVLWLEPSSAEAAAEEVVAAIEAMK
jgi:2-amino-4-hydroxy-6-hydroxymethyldihydropteridine diphosphokinase